VNAATARDSAPDRDEPAPPTRHPASRLALGFAAGAAHGLLLLASFWPLSLWWLSLVSIAPLAMSARACASAPSRRWLEPLGVFLAMLSIWLWYARWSAAVSDAGWPAMAIYMAAWPAAWVWLASRLWRARLRDASPGALSALGTVAIGGMAWAALESIRSLVIFDGYPWYLLAHPLADAPWLSQSAELWGVAPISFLCASSGVAVAFVARTHSGAWRRAALTMAAVWALVAAGGAIRLQTLEIQSGPVLTIVQTNQPVDNRTAPTPQQYDAAFVRAMNLSIEAVLDARRQGQTPALVVWPESSVPGFGLERDTILLQRHRGFWPGDRYLEQLESFVEQSGSPMLVGTGAYEGLRDDGDEWRWHRHHNSTYLVRGEMPFRRYDKLMLTPFGERMPYVRAFKPLERALMSLGARGFTFTLQEGEEEVAFELQDGTRFVTPICFEDTLAPLCRRLVMEAGRKQATLLVNVSNDGWFGMSDASRDAHLLAARWRAIELRVGLVRAANTGISAVVDPTGAVMARLAPREAGWITMQPQVSSMVTVYSRIGEVGSWALMTATLILLGVTMIRRERSDDGANAPGARGAAMAAAHRSAVSAARLACFVGAAALVLMTGCNSTPKGRALPTATNPNPSPPPSPDSPQVAMGLTGPLSQQPWSTKEQSIHPDQERSSDGTVSSKPVPPAIPVVSSGSVRQTAVDLLQAASRSSYPLHVANAIEALEADPKALAQVIRPALVNPNRGVRFVALMAIGRTRLDGMTTLVQPLLLDPSESVRAAAIYAMARLDAPVDMNPLAAMLRSDDPEVRGNAIMIFGELQNPSAVPLLRSTLGSKMPRVDPSRRKVTDLQMAETLAKLGEDDDLEPLRAALFSHPEHAELIALSCQALGRLKDGGSAAPLRILAYSGGNSSRPPEIRLLAFTALAQITTGDQTAAIEYGRRFLTDPNPQLRALAVRELAACAGGSVMPLLEARLYDSDATVQIAAAEAILRLTR